MKKVVALLMLAVVCFSLFSCVKSTEDVVESRVNQAAYEYWVAKFMRLDGQNIIKSRPVSIDEVIKGNDEYYVVTGEIELTDEIKRNWRNKFVVDVVWDDDEDKWIVINWEFVNSKWELG